MQSAQPTQKQQTVDIHADEILKAYKRTERLATGLFISTTLLLVLSLFFIINVITSNDNVRSLLTSIATSLLASLVFTVLYSFVVERARSQLESRARSLEIAEMTDTIAEEVSKSAQKISEHVERRISSLLEEEATRLVNSWPELLPKDYFPPTEQSDPRFLEQLGNAVRHTQHYIFRGATARYTPSFLLKYGPAYLNCSILILDPRAETAIQTHALHRSVMRDKGRPLHDYEEEIRQEIYRAIVHLFELRQRFRIEVRTCNDNLFYRSEIVDDGAFVSFYVGDKKALHPPSYFYTKTNGGFYYGAFRKDFEQSWRTAQERIVMSVDMKQDALEAFLIKLRAGDQITISKKIEDWKSQIT